MNPTKTITSVANEAVKHVVSLHLPKYRQEHQQFIAEGLRTITTLLQAGERLVALYVTNKMLPTIENMGLTHVIVSEHVINKMSAASTASGILGIFEIPSPSPSRITAGLVLARIADPGNMGTLIRSAAAMNVGTVVIVEGADPYSPKVIQATAGTIGNVNIFRIGWQELPKIAREKKLSLSALVVEGGKVPDKVDFKKSLLVVGSEAHGIPQEWLAECDEKITLSMPGAVESLNAAVAGSIALYLGYSK